MENLVFEIQASIGLGDVKLMNKDRNPELRLQQKDGGRMGRKRQRRKGGSRTEGLQRTFAAVTSAHRHSKICRKKGTASGNPVGRCEAVERNRRRFHGLVEVFRVSRVQNEQRDFQKIVGSSDHTGGSKRLSPREMECNAKEVGPPTISIEEMGTVARIKIGVGLFHCTESTYG